MLILPMGNPPQIALVLTVSAGMMCGGAYIFSTVPRAAITFVGLIGARTVLGLLFSGFGAIKWPFMVVVLCYVGTMWKASHWNYASHVRNWLQQITMNTQTDELIRQNEVINMLLKDFKETASDCLWEADLDGRITHSSNAFAGRLNVDPDKVNGQTMFSFLTEGGGDPVDLQRLQLKVRRHLSFTDERIKLVQDGTERWLRFSGKRKSDGGFRGVQSKPACGQH